jgi:hypothetical protein
MNKRLIIAWLELRIRMEDDRYNECKNLEDGHPMRPYARDHRCKAAVLSELLQIIKGD